MVVPIVEEPPATGLTSPGGGAHDDGDLMDALGDEGAWDMVGMPVDSTRARTQTVGPMVGNATQDPRTAMEHTAPETAPVMELSSRCSVQAQQHLRRSPPWIAAIQIEEIPWEPARSPHVFRTVIRRGDEFDMLEEEEATTEVERLRADPSVMMGLIEVSL